MTFPIPRAVYLVAVPIDLKISATSSFNSNGLSYFFIYLGITFSIF